jgi:hypothetical protein
MKKLLFAFLLTISIVLGCFAQTGKAELITQVKQVSWCDGMLADRHCVINVSNDCWVKLLDQNQTAQGAKWFRNMGYAITYFAKYMNWGNLTDKDGYDYGDKEKQTAMEEIADSFKTKISFTLDANDMPCTQANYELMMRYMGTIYDFLQQPDYQSHINGWKPKSGEMHIKLALSNKIKDIAVTTDGNNFIVTAPFINEPDDWNTKMIKGLAKGGSN